MDAGTPTLLGIAAIISSISGALTTVFGARAARKEATARAEDECREKLKAARLEAEDAAKELHDVKMRDYRES